MLRSTRFGITLIPGYDAVDQSSTETPGEADYGLHVPSPQLRSRLGVYIVTPAAPDCSRQSVSASQYKLAITGSPKSGGNRDQFVSENKSMLVLVQN